MDSIVFCDFETNNKRGEVVCWCLAYNDTSFFSGRDIASFFCFLRQEDNLICYFHNLNFDGVFILKYLTKKGVIQVLEMTDMKFYCECFYLCGEVDNYYIIKYKFGDNITTFKCSYKLFMISVENLAKFNVKFDNKRKDLINWNYENLEYCDKLVEYCLYDCLIVWEYFYNFVKQNSLKIEEIPLTAGSFAKNNLFRNFLSGDDKKKWKLTRKEYDLCKQWCYGGLTTCNYNHLNKWVHNVKMLDVNSMYPYAMRIFGAYGKIYSKEYIKQIIPKSRIKDEYWHMIKIKVFKWFNKKEYSGIVLSKQGVDFYNLDSERGYIACFIEEEWEQLLKMIDVEYIVLEEYYVKKGICDNLVRYIDKYYLIKKNSKNEIERNNAKLMLNSIHGKFGQNINDVVVDLNNSVKYLDEKWKKIDRETIEEWEHWNPRFYRNTKIRAHCCYLPQYFTITGMCRTMILKMIEKLGQNYINGDTDSVKYLINDETSKIFFDIGLELGQWKDEGTCEEYIILGNKQYIKKLDGKYHLTICGLSKQYINQQKNIEELITKLVNGEVIENSKLAKVKTATGLSLKNIQFSIKSKNKPLKK